MRGPVSPTGWAPTNARSVSSIAKHAFVGAHPVRDPCRNRACGSLPLRSRGRCRRRNSSPAQRGKVPQADGGGVRMKSRVAHRVGSYKGTFRFIERRTCFCRSAHCARLQFHRAPPLAPRTRPRRHSHSCAHTRNAGRAARVQPTKPGRGARVLATRRLDGRRPAGASDLHWWRRYPEWPAHTRMPAALRASSLRRCMAMRGRRLRSLSACPSARNRGWSGRCRSGAGDRCGFRGLHAARASARPSRRCGRWRTSP